MMRRVFACNSCDSVWERWYESIHDNGRPKQCPQCKSKDIYEEFSTNVVCNFLESARNFAHASEINKKRIGKEQLQLMEDADPVMSARKKQKAESAMWDIPNE